MQKKILTISPFILLFLLLISWGASRAFAEPQIITVYKEVDLRKTSVVVILNNAPSNNKAMYDYWLKIQPLLKEKHDIELSENIDSIVFMEPIYKEPRHFENEFCFSKYIKDENKCIDKDRIIFRVSYNVFEDYLGLFFSDPFCGVYVNNGSTLSSDNKCFK